MQKNADRRDYHACFLQQGQIISEEMHEFSYLNLKYSARNLLTKYSRSLLCQKSHTLKAKNATSCLHKCLSSCVKPAFRNASLNSSCASKSNSDQIRKYCVNISSSEDTEIWPKTVVIEGSRAQDIEKQEDGIILNYGKYNLNLLYIWLRDHCRCDVCYNKKTNQKNVDNYTLSSDIKPEHIDYNGQDGHFTCYSLDWLLENMFHPFHQDRVTKTLWNSHTLKDEALPTVEYKHYMESDEGLQKHLSNLLQFGFSIITGVFHVVEHDGEGGETLLVDGFYAAEQLRQKDAKAYEFLAKKVVAHEYNPCDRSPLFTLSAEDTRLFYNYYGKLTQEVQNKDNEFWVKLKPDMVLFVDNWRVMHGRSAFTGRRYVSGCYLNRDDWISRARDFGLLAQDIEKQENGIILNYGKYNLNLLYIWLRDHCRCDVCYNKKTNQKNVDNYTLSSDIKPEHIDYNGQDGHFTCYSLDWLLENTFHPFHQDRVTKKLWNSTYT
ncbi:hypothetical protein KUTeg_012640 [Tegillarca granosa]|uniref:trimethyllysine dioxygenase n=1 Tax=Tegillarca granosa TaxID=220873 RepID=A0ABQ9F023_TEGGR|nr:hypothetical protein KUTeg_012640 [Tegillarca granosa]